MNKRLLSHATVEMSVTIRLTEDELAALRAVAGYGDDAFLKVFYQHLGETYLRPHEAGLRSLFKAINEESPWLLDRAEQSRELFKKGGAS